MEKANRKQTIFSSKPLDVAACIFFGKKLVSRLKTVSMYWRVGLPRHSYHAGIGRLEFLKALLRMAVVWNVPLACDRASADFIISSPLMESEYRRKLPETESPVARELP